MKHSKVLWYPFIFHLLLFFCNRIKKKYKILFVRFSLQPNKFKRVFSMMIFRFMCCSIPLSSAYDGLIGWEWIISGTTKNENFLGKFYPIWFNCKKNKIENFIFFSTSYTFWPTKHNSITYLTPQPMISQIYFSPPSSWC